MRSLITTIIIATALTGCAGMEERLSRVNQPPPQSVPSVESMPMPPVVAEVKQGNSLWSAGRQTFFKDQRARTVGDILTVMVEISDKAELDNETKRDRTSSDGANASAVAGLEGYIGKVLPGTANIDALADFGSTTSHNGKGEVDREEKINMKLAAVVTNILPNGNMVIKGSQEVRVNFENRILNLGGVIRPEDITIDNTIGYEKIAEARINYGGKGQITDLQQPRYGTQVWDAVFPF